MALRLTWLAISRNLPMQPKHFEVLRALIKPLEVGYKQHLWDDRYVNHQLMAALGRNIYPQPIDEKSQ